MKTLSFVISIVLCFFMAVELEARDDRQRYPVSEVVNNPEYAARLEGVEFYFGAQPHPGILEDFGEWPTNKKTNAFGKSDKFACQWAMLSALLSLHQRAVSLGANAVINIHSNYKSQEFVSETHFECGAGAVMAGVALKGTIVRTNNGASRPSSNNARSTSSAATAQSGENARADIAEAQRILNSLGLEVGPADGVMGPRTATALSNFQRISGIQATGQLDAQTLDALRRAAAQPPDENH